MNPRTAKEFPEYFESKDYGSRVCRLVLKKKKEDAIVPLTFVFCGMLSLRRNPEYTAEKE